MLILNRKIAYSAFLIFSVWLFLFFNLQPAAALTAPAVQVKTKDSPTVYFLSNRHSVRKTYINAASYLSYGNKWSEIKIIDPAELAMWPEANLFQASGSDDIYYISGYRKILIKSPADLMRFNLTGDPVLEVSTVDLAQYQSASYVDIGWEEPASVVSFAVSCDTLEGAHNNTLVTNTDRNLLGIFRFRAPDQTATLTSITFNLGGIYTRSIVSSIMARDEDDRDYDANVNWRQNEHQIVINFRPPLEFLAGEEKVVKILADLGACPTCTNQTMRLELSAATDIEASLPVSSAVWPIQSTAFTLLANDKLLAQVRLQAETLGDTGSIVGGSRVIAKFKIYEDSGQEDAIIKQIIFRNNGSANKNDWDNFRLLKDGQVIARVATVDSNNRIDFNINYLRIAKDGSAALTVEAGLINAYNPQATYGLQVSQLTAVGNTYNLTVNPEIHNISESHTLN
ncbi:MAG: hypothetical protein WC456_02035 [Patescibacteria group bacterium]